MNPAAYSCKNGKYLASIIDDSIVTWDEIIEEIKAVPTNFNEKNITCKMQNFYILLAFLLITIALLIAVSIYCYLIKIERNKTLITISFLIVIKLIKSVSNKDKNNCYYNIFSEKASYELPKK